MMKNTAAELQMRCVFGEKLGPADRIHDYQFSQKGSAPLLSEALFPNRAQF
jgi:hypothetical protein